MTQNNPCSYVDDNTTNDAGLKAATRNSITVYRANSNVTMNCKFKVTDIVLPDGLKLYTETNNNQYNLIE